MLIRMAIQFKRKKSLMMKIKVNLMKMMTKSKTIMKRRVTLYPARSLRKRKSDVCRLDWWVERFSHYLL
jgi:hypothetical protein